MKTIVLLVVVVCGSFFVNQVNAQMAISIYNLDETMKAEKIDDLLFTAKYEMTFIHDTVKPESRQEETMMLKVGKNVSQFYSYSKYMSDSLVNEAIQNGTVKETFQDIVKQFQPKITYQLYKNFPVGKVMTLDRLAMSSFRCEEENERPVWQIQSDTMTINTYPCQKATCRFKGRDYDAWFTTEIPISEGPWKLYGLPGLIIKATDSEGHYTFECTGIQQAHPGGSIMYGGKDYEPMSRKNLNKLYERFSSDPVGYIKSMAPNVTITIQGEDGQPAKDPKNMPYNPIEREGK